ncbi:hypothetical protein D3C73_437400 [compost metagenome]
MSKIQCEIIKDLLPLYIDQVCSEESRQLVEEHLAGCNSCRHERENIQSDIPISKETVAHNRSEGNAIKDLSTFWNRSKVKAFIKGVILTALSFTIILLGYLGLFEWNITTVSTDVIEITEVSQLADGRIAYHVKITDGYDLNQASYDVDEDGNFYVTPYRPIVKKKPITKFGLFNMYDQIGEMENHIYQTKYGEGKEIKALYYGSRKDNILVWKKGMELPPASAKVEAEFDENRDN